MQNSTSVVAKSFGSQTGVIVKYPNSTKLQQGEVELWPQMHLWNGNKSIHPFYEKMSGRDDLITHPQHHFHRNHNEKTFHTAAI